MTKTISEFLGEIDKRLTLDEVKEDGELIYQDDNECFGVEESFIRRIYIYKYKNDYYLIVYKRHSGKSELIAFNILKGEGLNMVLKAISDMKEVGINPAIPDKCICYDCPNKRTTLKCNNEQMKYYHLMMRIRSAIRDYDNKYWIDIDFDHDDKVANAALSKCMNWLTDNGYTYGEPTYRSWCMYADNGKPVVDCGCHHGTLYFHKRKKVD